MKEGKSVYKSLLGVELYEISNNYIYRLRNSHRDPDEVFEFLPEFTINTNNDGNNKIMPARYFHQYTGMIEESDNKKFLFFNLKTVDANLLEEISQAGIEDLFKNIDFKSILSNFIANTEEDHAKFVFPHTNYVVVETTYITSYDHYSGGYDCDSSYDIIGYVDDEMNFKSFK